MIDGPQDCSVIPSPQGNNCQAQAQVRLSLRLSQAQVRLSQALSGSLRLSQALSGSLRLSQALSGSYSVTLTLLPEPGWVFELIGTST